MWDRLLMLLPCAATNEGEDPSKHNEFCGCQANFGFGVLLVVQLNHHKNYIQVCLLVITCLRCKWLAIFETTQWKLLTWCFIWGNLSVWLQNIKNLNLGDLFIGIHFPKSLFLSSIGDICAHLLYLTSLPSNKISRSQNAKPEPRKKKKITNRNMVTWQCDILEKNHQLRSFFWGEEKKTTHFVMSQNPPSSLRRLPLQPVALGREATEGGAPRTATRGNDWILPSKSFVIWKSHLGKFGKSSKVP